MAFVDLVLWFQFAYAVWQFVRVAKFCRLPYAILAHTFMWLIGRWDRPFTVRNYTVLDPPRQRYYINPDVTVGALMQPWKENKRGRDCTLEKPVSAPDTLENPVPAPDIELAVEIPPSYKLRQLDSVLLCLTLKDGGLDYKLCSRKLENTFVWNYLRDDPDCFVRSADLIFPNFEILDRVRHLDGLKKICHGQYIPVCTRRRFLAVPDRERELNQNFMRILASVPLMAQAKGFQNPSVWISLAIIGIDQFSLLFNWLWQRFKESLFFVFQISMIQSSTWLQPRTRRTVCTFFSTISDRMMFCDEVRMNFIRLKKGDVVYTMSPFDGADFEIVKGPPFQRKRKDPVPYTKAIFGRYEQANGQLFPEDGFLQEGTPIISHHILGSRIDTMFRGGGGFHNFINNQHLHFGHWSERWNDFDNFQDLLQVMEEREMLPLLQTDAKLFKSLKFNDFLSRGKSLEDITFLKVKKNGMVGGKM